MDNDKKQSGSAIAWLALIVSIISLILAWTAFNRSGTDLEQIIEEEVGQARMEIEAEYQQTEDEVRQEASESLMEASVDVSTDEDPNTVGE